MMEPIWHIVFTNDAQIWLATRGLWEGADATENGWTWLWCKKRRGRNHLHGPLNAHCACLSIHSFMNHNCRKWTDLNSFEVGQVLLNLATQLGRNLEDGVVVLHHEGHQFGGEQLIQVHLIYWAQNAVWEHLHHLDRDNRIWIRSQLPAALYAHKYRGCTQYDAHLLNKSKLIACGANSF